MCVGGGGRGVRTYYLWFPGGQCISIFFGVRGQAKFGL